VSHGRDDAVRAVCWISGAGDCLCRQPSRCSIFGREDQPDFGPCRHVHFLAGLCGSRSVAYFRPAPPRHFLRLQSFVNGDRLAVALCRLLCRQDKGTAPDGVTGSTDKFPYKIARFHTEGALGLAAGTMLTLGTPWKGALRGLPDHIFAKFGLTLAVLTMMGTAQAFAQADCQAPIAPAAPNGHTATQQQILG